MDNNKILDISKIKTGVPGFDDLFYGGLRLPGWKGGDSSRDGICIVIYGDRGISKSDLAMQIMRGVDEFLGKYYKTKNKLTPRYRTLNHRESELRKKYLGLEVGNMVNNIKLPNCDDECSCTCKLCSYFPDIREAVGGMPSVIPNNGTCGNEEIKNCYICKLLRHEIINYSDRSQSMHWTYGNTSDTDNLIANLDVKSIETGDIFDKDNTDTISSDYASIAYRQFKKFQEEISQKIDSDNNQADGDRDKDKDNDFAWSSYVIEGFTAFRQDELERLPFTDLILKLRKTSAVSILVFDERGAKLHLNADILIHMQYNTDEIAKYMYYQLEIVKSDLQQHVHGWHKYRKLRDLSVKIYPSMHSLLTRRFSSDNAVLRLEQDNMRYPQSLLNRFRYNCALHDGKVSEHAAKTIKSAIEDNHDRMVVYSPSNSTVKVQLIDSDKYKALYDDIAHETLNDDTTIAVFLLGKTEQYFRRIVSDYGLSENALRNVHYWETGIGCIWAEEYTSIIKDYIYRWKKRSGHTNLHIVIDDYANINLFPLMNKEPLLAPALVNICKNASMCQGFDENDRGIQIILSFVCTNPDIPQNRVIQQLVNNQ